MAQRPVFMPSLESDYLVTTEFVDFDWYPGFSVAQKQRSISSLHQKIIDRFNIVDILEISSKSLTEVGVKASAFNLMIKTKKHNRTYSVECAFQSSKVFENGGPFLDILEKSSREAKKDERLKSSGRLRAFSFYKNIWPLEPKTLFYDWLYLNALNNNGEIADSILNYQCFTDIEFNPARSINCQAYSAALYVSLTSRGMLQDALSSPVSYIEIINSFKFNGAHNQIPDSQMLL